MAAAQICACEWAKAEAERGITPASAASPITWTLGWSLETNVIGSTGHHPVRSATPASSAAGQVSRRDDARDRGLVLVEIGRQRSRESRDRPIANAPLCGGRPIRSCRDRACCHAVSNSFCMVKAPAWRRARSRWISACRIFKIPSDQAGALVRRGRAARRIDRRGNHHRAAVLHRFELVAKREDLRPRVVGRRHCPLPSRPGRQPWIAPARNSMPGDITRRS